MKSLYILILSLFLASCVPPSRLEVQSAENETLRKIVRVEDATATICEYEDAQKNRFFVVYYQDSVAVTQIK